MLGRDISARAIASPPYVLLDRRGWTSSRAVPPRQGFRNRCTRSRRIDAHTNGPTSEAHEESPPEKYCVHCRGDVGRSARDTTSDVALGRLPPARDNRCSGLSAPSSFQQLGAGRDGSLPPLPLPDVRRPGPGTKSSVPGLPRARPRHAEQVAPIAALGHRAPTPVCPRSGAERHCLTE